MLSWPRPQSLASPTVPMHQSVFFLPGPPICAETTLLLSQTLAHAKSSPPPTPTHTLDIQMEVDNVGTGGVPSSTMARQTARQQRKGCDVHISFPLWATPKVKREGTFALPHGLHWGCKTLGPTSPASPLSCKEGCGNNEKRRPDLPMWSVLHVQFPRPSAHTIQADPTERHVLHCAALQNGRRSALQSDGQKGVVSKMPEAETCVVWLCAVVWFGLFWPTKSGGGRAQGGAHGPSTGQHVAPCVKNAACIAAVQGVAPKPTTTKDGPRTIPARPSTRGA